MEISHLNLLLGREDSCLFIYFSNKPVFGTFARRCHYTTSKEKEVISFFCFSLIILFAVEEYKYNSSLGSIYHGDEGMGFAPKLPGIKS